VLDVRFQQTLLHAFQVFAGFLEEDLEKAARSMPAARLAASLLLMSPIAGAPAVVLHPLFKP
jgi:hypothetical protein